MTLQPADGLAVSLGRAIKTGDLDALARLLAEHSELATVRIMGRRGGWRTSLHLVTDWPGHFPNGPETVRLLVAAGADVNATCGGTQPETPLHWAASSDDREVAEALLDAGADIEAPGASIAGGPPLDDAVGYGCWAVARLLVARGAQVNRLWHAAALGLLPRVRELVEVEPPPSAEEINNAFWQACAGAQPRTAAYLLAHGADLNWKPSYADHTPLEIASALPTRRQLMVSWLREQTAP